MGLDVLDSDQAVTRFLNTQAPSTHYKVKSMLKGFFEYMAATPKFRDYTPAMLVEYQAALNGREAYELCDHIQAWLYTLRGTEGGMKTRLSRVLRFFYANRAALPDWNYRIEPTHDPVPGHLSVENVHTLILNCNPMYRTIFTCMFMGALCQDMFSHWNRHGLEATREQIETGHKIIKVDLPGRKRMKHKRPYYTLLGGDSLTFLKQHLEETPRVEGAIFRGKYGRPINKQNLKNYWKYHMIGLGIIEPPENATVLTRYGFNIHEMRDLFRSQWSMSPAKYFVAEYLMGHMIDKDKYDKSFRNVAFYRGEYRKALPKLNIVSQYEALGYIKEDRITELETELQEARAKITEMIHTDELRTRLNTERNKSLEKELQEIREWIKERERAAKLRERLK